MIAENVLPLLLIRVQSKVGGFTEASTTQRPLILMTFMRLSSTIRTWK
jgi:hypothetical protein